MTPSSSLAVLLCLTRALLSAATIDTGSFQIYNVDHNKCVVALTPTVVQVAPCNPASKNQQFRWASQFRLLSLSQNLCLGAQEQKSWVKVLLFPCDEKSELQHWECKNETLFGLKGHKLHLNYGNRQEKNVMIFDGTGTWSRWKMYGSQTDLCSKGYQEVFTLRGNSFGAPCQFPFKFGEKWYAECTLDGRSDGELWCATETDYNNAKKWGFCPATNTKDWDSDPVTGVVYQRNTQSVLSWHQARISCQQQDADLLSIVELHEQSYISGLTNTLSTPLWIGLNSLDFESGWQWSNGNPFRYLNWAPGHPSTEPGLSCAALHAGKASKWESEVCSKKLGYICRKGNSTTLPPAPIGSDQPSFCPNYWVPYAGHCYYLDRTKKIWRDAMAACRKEGADLASIHHIEEQSFIISQSGYLPATDELWIGLNDQRSQNLFEWSDRTHVTFAQWQAGEPSHGTNLQEDCVVIKGLDGKWVDRVCEKTHGYICKMKASTQQLAGATDEVSSGCKLGWNRFGSNCFSVGSEAKTFEEAKTACQESGSRLVEISDRYENALLVSLVGLRPEKYFWTGMSNKDSLETFSWTTGSKVKFTHFNVGMPARKQGCVAMTTGIFAGLWDVVDCDRKEKYVCKKMADGITSTSVPPTTAALSCADGWSPAFRRDVCFKYFRKPLADKRTWSEARDFCRAVGGDLLSIHSSSDLTRLPYISSAWIGLSTLDPNSGYTWSDGSPFEFEEWGYGEPNNYNDNEYCVETQSSYGSMEWNDRYCEAYNDWICQIRKGVKPSPAPAVVVPVYNITSDGWTEYDGAHYYFNMENLGMLEARDYCQKRLGDLVVITGNNERTFLWKKIAREHENQFYIGMIVNLDKSFSWLDGSPVSYTAWSQNEPNFANNDENCVTIYKNGGHWNDINCGMELPSICKRNESFVNTTMAPTTIPKGGCSPEWIRFQGKCYQIVGGSNTKPWTDARDYCQSHGGNLVSILNEMEQAFLTTQMVGRNYDLWIGLNDYNWEMRFLWTEGRKVRYTNWAKGHPTSVPDGRYSFEGTFDCVVMVGSNSKQIGLWKVDDCTMSQGFICKRNIDSQILPPATTVSTTHNFLKLGNDSLKLVTQKMKWDEARRQCQAEDADLASVLNPITQAFITLHIHKYGEPVWIGLNSNLTDGYYRWVDNWRLSYTKWGENEPKSNQACVYIDVDGSWKTGLCSETHHSLCKISEDIAPTQPSQLPGICPQSKKRRSWVPFRGHCYNFLNSATDDWARATVECMRMGATMLSIEDPVESRFIQESIELLHDSTKSFWIGLHKSHEGRWMWVDNSVLDYINWRPGFHLSKDPNLCAEIRSDTGYWITSSCTRYKSYICKTPKVIVPTKKPPVVARITEDAPHGYAGIVVAVVLLIITAAGLLGFLFRNRTPTPVLGESTFNNRLYFNSDPSRTITTVDTKGLVANIEQNEQA